MANYLVSYMVIYSDVVSADSAEEAAKIVANDCPYDVDGSASVINLDTDEEWEEV